MNRFAFRRATVDDRRRTGWESEHTVEATFRVARQTSRSCRFARVSVAVSESAAESVEVATAASDDAAWRREAALGASRALRALPGTYRVSVTSILATVADTGVGDVYEASARAVWQATGLDHEHRDAGFYELELVAGRFRDLTGRRLDRVTESRHWYQGARGGDTDSLVHVWLHFAGVLPLRLSVHGEVLGVTIVDPGGGLAMQQYGEIRIGPAQSPDLLARFVGRTLTAATVFRGYSPERQCGGLRLNFDGKDLVIGAFADEWVLAPDAVPSHLAAYWSASPSGDNADGV